MPKDTIYLASKKSDTFLEVLLRLSTQLIKKMTEVHLEKQNQTILPPFALKLLSFKPNFSVPFFFPFQQYNIILATLALSDS